MNPNGVKLAEELAPKLLPVKDAEIVTYSSSTHLTLQRRLRP